MTMHPKIKVGAVLPTKDGRKVRIICVDRPGAFPVIAYDVAVPYNHGDVGSLHTFTAQGQMSLDGGRAIRVRDLDLGPTKLYGYKANDRYIFYADEKIGRYNAGVVEHAFLTATLDEGSQS